MNKNNKIITYNAQGQLIIDNPITKYENKPNPSLFSPSSEYNDSYFIIEDNTDGSSTISWNSTYVNECDNSEDNNEDDIWLQFKTKNIKFTESRTPWYIINKELKTILEENDEILVNKFNMDGNNYSMYNGTISSIIPELYETDDTAYFNSNINTIQIIIIILIILLILGYITYKIYKKIQ